MVALTLCLSAALTSSAAPAPKAGPSRELLVVGNKTGKWQIYLVQPGTGETKQLSDNTTSDLCPAWSPDGKRIAFVSYRDGGRDIWTMKADGTDLRRLTKGQECCTTPQWSPDGKRIASVGPWDYRGRIYTVEVATGKVTQLSKEMQGQPKWSPDGKKLSCMYCERIEDYAYIMDADGKNGRKLSDKHDSSASWSPDGNRLAVIARSAADNSWQVYTIGADGKNQEQLTKEANVEHLACPQWSPDGTRIAFSVMVGGARQVAVVRADGRDLKVITSKHNHQDIRWSPDGKSLSYTRSEDGKHPAVWVSDPNSGYAKEVFPSGGSAEWKPR